MRPAPTASLTAIGAAINAAIRLLISAAALSLGLYASATQAQPSTADAGAVSDPYSASVPIAAQNPELREAALREALGIVLARVSGMAGGSELAVLSASAPQLVQRYGYQRDAQGALTLLAGFDRQAVDARLRAAGLPVWGAYAATAERFALTITGVRDSSQYLDTLHRIEQIGGVRTVSVVAAQGDTLQLSIEADGGQARFRSAVASAGDPGARWLPLVAPSADSLAYRLP